MEYGEKTDNHGKWETHIVGIEIWRETLKNQKNDKFILQDLEYGGETEIVENVTQRLFDLEYGENHSKMWKMRNAHCRNWSLQEN